MKVVKRYVCEKCGWAYEKEEAARKCEATHRDGKVIDMHFVPGNRYPDKIDVKFDGGAVVTYFCEGV